MPCSSVRSVTTARMFDTHGCAAPGHRRPVSEQPVAVGRRGHTPRAGEGLEPPLDRGEVVAVPYGTIASVASATSVVVPPFRTCPKTEEKTRLIWSEIEAVKFSRPPYPRTSRPRMEHARPCARSLWQTFVSLPATLSRRLDSQTGGFKRKFEHTGPTSVSAVSCIPSAASDRRSFQAPSPRTSRVALTQTS
jgi:hypothetical protein